MLTLRNVASFQLQQQTSWRTLVDDTGFYLSDSWTSIYALDVPTFDERWSIPAEQYEVKARIGSVLLVENAAKRRIRALDIATGKTRWTTRRRSVYAWRGGVLLTSDDGNDYEIVAPADGTVVERGRFPKGAWLLLEDAVIVKDEQGRLLRAWAPGSNRPRWELRVPDGGLAGARLVTALPRRDTFFGPHSGPEARVVWTRGDTIAALELQHGNQLWRTKKPKGAEPQRLIGRHLLLESETELIVYDAATGRRCWSQPRARYGAQPANLDAYGPYFLGVKNEKLLVSALDTGQIVGTWKLPKSVALWEGIVTWKDLIILFLEHGRVQVLKPADAAKTRRKAPAPKKPAPPSAVKNHALGPPRRGKAGEPLLLHTIVSRHKKLGPWLATETGLVVADGRWIHVEALTLYRREAEVLRPVWESRCRWSPRLVADGHLIVMDVKGDRIGACSLADGTQLWEMPSVEGAVWRMKGKLVVWHPGGEVQLVRPNDGRVVVRHRLPRPYVLGLFGDVVVCRDAWLADGDRYKKHVRAKPPKGMCSGVDAQTGRTLWEQPTDAWFGGSSESEVLEWNPDEQETIGDCPPVLLMGSAGAERRVFRGLSPRDLRPRWTARPRGGFFQWEPAMGLYVFWQMYESNTAIVELLDPESGSIHRVATGLPKVDSQKVHWAWGRYLGVHGTGLVFQHADVCVDVLNSKSRRTRHYPLPKPVEVQNAGSFGDLLVLSREKALDVANVPGR